MTSESSSSLSESAALETVPDHQLAAQELDALFASLGVTYQISKPEFKTDETGWDHFAYSVSYSVGRQTAAFQWRAGIGCVDWKAVKRNPCFMHRNDNAIDSLSSLSGGKLTAHGKTLQNEVMTAIAELTSARTTKTDAERAANPALASARRMIKPINPAEVLACCCREGVDSSEVFPDWCANFGYEEDSRAVLATYLACQEEGVKARAIAGQHFATFAELSARL